MVKHAVGLICLFNEDTVTFQQHERECAPEGEQESDCGLSSLRRLKVAKDRWCMLQGVW